MIARVRGVYETFKNMILTALSYVMDKWNGFKTWFLEFWERIKSIVRAARDWIATAFNSLRERFAGFFDPILNSLSAVISGIKTQIVSLLSGLKGKFTDWLGIDVDGMIAGINKIQSARDANGKATLEYLKTANEAGKKAGETGAAKVRAQGGKFSYDDLLPDFLKGAMGGAEGSGTDNAGVIAGYIAETAKALEVVGFEEVGKVLEASRFTFDGHEFQLTPTFRARMEAIFAEPNATRNIQSTTGIYVLSDADFINIKPIYYEAVRLATEPEVPV